MLQRKKKLIKIQVYNCKGRSDSPISGLHAYRLFFYIFFNFPMSSPSTKYTRLVVGRGKGVICSSYIRAQVLLLTVSIQRSCNSTHTSAVRTVMLKARVRSVSLEYVHWQTPPQFHNTEGERTAHVCVCGGGGDPSTQGPSSLCGFTTVPLYYFQYI